MQRCSQIYLFVVFKRSFVHLFTLLLVRQCVCVHFKVYTMEPRHSWYRLLLIWRCCRVCLCECDACCYSVQDEMYRSVIGSHEEKHKHLAVENHELRNILTYLLTELSTLTRGCAQSDQREDVVTISSSLLSSLLACVSSLAVSFLCCLLCCQWHSSDCCMSQDIMESLDLVSWHRQTFMK